MGTSVLGEHTATVFTVEDIEDSTNLHYCRKHKSCVCVCVCADLDSSCCCIILYKYNDVSTASLKSTLHQCASWFRFYVTHLMVCAFKTKLTKLRGLSPHANYTDRAAAAGRRS